jgi:hypothetical protein
VILLNINRKTVNYIVSGGMKEEYDGMKKE